MLNCTDSISINPQTTSVGEDEEKKRTLCTVVELEQPLWKTVGRFLKKLKIELSYDPAIPFLGTYSKKSKTLI